MSLALRDSGQILWLLAKKGGYKVDLQFTHKKIEYRATAELMHFHLDFLRNEKCRSLAGILLPKI
jgi:hypothetical protein